MRKLEQRLYVELRRAVHYALCLERECARLGNPVAGPRNITLRDAQALLAEIKERAP
jgi:hypothetical protein